MRTKLQYGEFILNDLAKFDKPNDEALDIRDVYVVMDMYTSQLAEKGLLLNMSKYNDNTIGSAWVMSFPNVRIYFDPTQNLCYSDLPCSYISLPNGMGIDYIGPMMNRSIAYWQLDRNGLSAFRNSPAAGLGGNIGYYPEQDRAYYVGNIDGSKVFDGSTIIDTYQRFVTTGLEAVADNAPYPLPQNYVAPVLEMVRQWYLGKDYADKVADGAERKLVVPDRRS